MHVYAVELVGGFVADDIPHSDCQVGRVFNVAAAFAYGSVIHSDVVGAFRANNPYFGGDQVFVFDNPFFEEMVDCVGLAMVFAHNSTLFQYKT